MINLSQTFPKLKEYFLYSVIIILIFLLILFGAKSCEYKNENFKLQDKLLTSEYSKFQPFIEKRAEDSSTIVEQNQLLAEKDNTIVKQIEKIEGLKSLQSQVVYKTIVQFDSIKIPYIDSAKVITKDSAEYIQVPLRAEIINKDYQIDETVLSNGIEINHLIIPDSTVVTIGEEGNLFKTKSVVKISHSNSHLKTTDVKNIVLNQKLNKGTKGFLIGTATGATAATIVIALLKAFVIK